MSYNISQILFFMQNLFIDNILSHINRCFNICIYEEEEQIFFMLL